MIRVNDKWELVPQEGMTVEDVLIACRFTHRQVVVSINGVLVPPDAYGAHLIHDGDAVRVVHVIGGG